MFPAVPLLVREICSRALMAFSEDDMIISSYVLETIPEKCEAVIETLATFEGVEVHERVESRLVVSIEADTTEDTYALATKMTQLDGVFAVNLVYCNFEDETLAAQHS